MAKRFFYTTFASTKLLFMDTLHIEFPFDREMFKREQMLIWHLLWKKRKRTIKNSSIFAVIFIAFSLLIYFCNDTSGNIYWLLALLYVLYIFYLFYGMRFSKRTHQKLIDRIANRYEMEKMDCIYEFSYDMLKYKDKEKQFEYKWDLFPYYSIYKNYLILFHSDNLKSPMLVFEDNVLYADKYNQIKSFIDLKVEYKNFDSIF